MLPAPDLSGGAPSVDTYGSPSAPTYSAPAPPPPYIAPAPPVYVPATRDPAPVDIGPIVVSPDTELITNLPLIEPIVDLVDVKIVDTFDVVDLRSVELRQPKAISANPSKDNQVKALQGEQLIIDLTNSQPETLEIVEVEVEVEQPALPPGYLKQLRHTLTSFPSV